MVNQLPETILSRNVPNIPAPMRSMIEQRTVFIFNVGPHQYPRYQGSLGTFFIPACPEGEEVSGPLMYQGKPGLPSLVPESVVEAVDGRTVTYKWDFTCEGHKLALDLIGKSAFRDASDDLTQYGVFIAKGSVPTQDEIDAARAKWEATCGERVRRADQNFEVNGGMEQGDNGKSYPGITKDDVTAARVLGLDRPWARKNAKMIPCLGCGQSVAPSAVRCHHNGCGAILDEVKARQLFPHLYAHEAEKRGPGRPPKDN